MKKYVILQNRGAYLKSSRASINPYDWSWDLDDAHTFSSREKANTIVKDIRENLGGKCAAIMGGALIVRTEKYMREIESNSYLTVL